MFLLALVEMIILILLLAFIGTQIIVPLFRGTPVFWLFRNKAPRKKLEDLESQIAVQTEEETVRKRQSDLDELLKRRKEDLDRQEEQLRRAQKAAGKYYDPEQK